MYEINLIFNNRNINLKILLALYITITQWAAVIDVQWAPTPRSFVHVYALRYLY